MLDVRQITDGVAAAAKEYPIVKAELFGSYASGKHHAHSDVDLLIEFSSARISLLTLNGLKYRLEELLDAPVDIVHGPLPEDSMLEIGRRIPLYGTFA